MQAHLPKSKLIAMLSFPEPSQLWERSVLFPPFCPGGNWGSKKLTAMAQGSGGPSQDPNPDLSLKSCPFN